MKYPTKEEKTAREGDPDGLLRREDEKIKKKLTDKMQPRVQRYASKSKFG